MLKVMGYIWGNVVITNSQKHSYNFPSSLRKFGQREQVYDDVMIKSRSNSRTSRLRLSITCKASLFVNDVSIIGYTRRPLYIIQIHKLIFTHFISVWNIYFLLSVADMFYGQMNLIIEVYLIYTVGESFRFHLQIMSSQNCMKEIFKKNRIPLQSNRGLNKWHTGAN